MGEEIRRQATIPRPPIHVFCQPETGRGKDCVPEVISTLQQTMICSILATALCFATRRLILLFTFEGELFTFKAKTPACVPLFQFPPRIAARRYIGHNPIATSDRRWL